VNCATAQGMFRIIQSIPSPKAEPFKQWMAQVAADRLDQMQDPELSIQQAMADYKQLGYSDNWINQRLKAIEVRKDLTDAWKKRGVQEGQQFAMLTDIITNTWSGFTTREYKAYKGLHKENLRTTDQHRADSQYARGGIYQRHNRGNRAPNAGGTQSGRTARWHDRPQCPIGTRSQNRQKGGFASQCQTGLGCKERRTNRNVKR